MAGSPRGWLGRLAAGTALGLVFLVPTIDLHGEETVNNALWITDGEVRAIAEADGRVYLGGEFSAVGPAIGATAVFDVATGAAQAPFSGVVGTVQPFSVRKERSMNMP